MDKRANFARIPYVQPCVVLRHGRRKEAMLCNLSVLGTYVTFARSLAEEIPDVGEEIQITFFLPGDLAPLSAEATVTWQNLDEPDRVEGLPPGFGARFSSMAPDDHQRIADLIADYRTSPQPRIAAPAPQSGLTRIPYVHSCLLTGDGGTWEGVLCNLSLAGAYIAVDPIPPREERLQLRTHLPGDVGLVLVEVEVAWVNPEEPRRAGSLPPGCGARFVSLDPTIRDRIQGMIAAYTSLPRDDSPA